MIYLYKSYRLLNSVDPDEMAHVGHLIRIYTICIYISTIFCVEGI